MTGNVVDTGNSPRPALTVAVAFPAVEMTMNHVGGMQRIQVTLTNLVLTVDNTLDYGSKALFTLPNYNLICIGCEPSLTVTKGNITNGILTTKDVDLAIGTAAASNTTLSSTMVNILPKQSLTADTVNIPLAVHSLAATPVLTGILKGAANQFFLNTAITGGITADDTLTFNGTIDFYFLNLGNILG